MDGAAAAGVTRAEKPQDQTAGPAHEKKHGASEGEECFHGSGHGEGDVFGALQGQSLRHQLAQQNVQVGDEAESDRDGDAVSINRGVWNFVNETEGLHQTGDHGFADPAQGEADHGDAQLNAVDDFVQTLMQALDDAGAGAAGFDELLNARVADADQGEFRSREKRIGCHQEKDQKHAEQHKGDHVWVILMGNSSIPKGLGGLG